MRTTQAEEVGDGVAATVWAAQAGADFDRFIKHGLSAIGVTMATEAMSKAIAQTDATAAVAAALSHAASQSA